MTFLEPGHALTLIHQIGDKGAIFSVDFVKRNEPVTRTMVCRLGVTKGVTGKGKAYDPLERLLLDVYDMHAQGFRSIPLDSIFGIRSTGLDRL